VGSSKTGRDEIRNQQAVGSIPIVGSMKKLSLTVCYRIVGLSLYGVKSGCVRKLYAKFNFGDGCGGGLKNLDAYIWTICWEITLADR